MPPRLKSQRSIRGFDKYIQEIVHSRPVSVLSKGFVGCEQNKQSRRDEISWDKRKFAEKFYAELRSEVCEE